MGRTGQGYRRQIGDRPLEITTGDDDKYTVYDARPILTALPCSHPLHGPVRIRFTARSASAGGTGPVCLLIAGACDSAVRRCGQQQHLHQHLHLHQHQHQHLRRCRSCPRAMTERVARPVSRRSRSEQPASCAAHAAVATWSPESHPWTGSAEFPLPRVRPGKAAVPTSAGARAT